MIPMDVWGVEVKPGQAEDVKERVENVNNQAADTTAEDDKKVSKNLDGYSTDPDNYSTDDEYSGSVDLTREDDSSNEEDSSDVENKNSTKPENVKKRVETVNNQVADSVDDIKYLVKAPADNDKKVTDNLDGYSTDPDNYSTDDEYSGSVDLTGEDDTSNGEDSSDEQDKNSMKLEDVKKRVETVNNQVADSIDDIKYLVKAPAEDDEKVTDNLDGYSTDPDNYSTDDEYSGSVDLTGDDDSSNEEDSSDEEVKNTTKPEDGKKRVSETVLKKPASNKKAKIETLSGQNAGVEVKLGQAEDVKESLEIVNNQVAIPIAADDKVGDNLDGYSTDPDNYSIDDEYSGSVDLAGEEDSSDEENRNSTNANSGGRNGLEVRF